jgi:hypothetical protein
VPIAFFVIHIAKFRRIEDQVKTTAISVYCRDTVNQMRSGSAYIDNKSMGRVYVQCLNRADELFNRPTSIRNVEV